MLTFYMAYNGTCFSFDKFCHCIEKTIGKILEFFPHVNSVFFYFLGEKFHQFLLLFLCFLSLHYGTKLPLEMNFPIRPSFEVLK